MSSYQQFQSVEHLLCWFSFKLLGSAQHTLRAFTRHPSVVSRLLSTMAPTAKYNVLFVLGGPGAGKGTQCEKIVAKYGYVHLSAGDLLRAERADKTSKNGDLIEWYITNGAIVPVEITIELIKNAMENTTSTNSFLIDGFPRNKDNLDGWTKIMDDKAEVKQVLNFDLSEEECLARAMKRGETSGRTDDNVESFKKRFVTFKESTQPIIDHFEVKNLVTTISSVPGPDEVFVEVCKVLDNLQ
ncbi:hypothetical protein SARC_03911 [Sphaeroforma arctica JP610]|uniref:UMP-CMP kinase n=1 Tax=Sphaeroforma arctica JP610 TaxID=667725 RepID=A0A0L0G4M6_9EUKA|nr:hypothetical protein SARC_03911 [Sphaeroforma arctica JP610]KNC83854.1 hypothetical protein SARC_03911 [Sphaeroforma arctica JP610]|eukprot:XP_014157756.1 hypothetical protein SARC_03911 [Sphaeroforma arctica JP610]